MRSTRESVLIEVPEQAPAPAPAPRSHAGSPPHAARPRLHGIDMLRGAVMALMVLDHTRDFFAAASTGMNPRDVTAPALFLTRWVTHFCAPVFIFLTGVSACLYGRRENRTPADVSRFLLTRGVWMIALELTVVNFGWTFDVRLNCVTLQVIWAIGWSMIAVAALVRLPIEAIVAFVILAIGGHNLLDSVHAGDLGSAGWLWAIVHEPREFGVTPGRTVLALYPLIPWVAVMAAGYALGPVMHLESAARRRALAYTGLGLIALFIVLRATNLYGDPAPWAAQSGWFSSILSFVNCEKYPPSLLFLAMTLGPALLCLGFADGIKGRVPAILITLGRVPLFYYVAHLYLIHLLAVLLAVVSRGEVRWLFGGVPLANKPDGFSVDLPLIYLLWLLVVALLYPLCRWFAALKQRRRDWWLSYL